MNLGIFGSRIVNRYDDYKRIREEILKINDIDLIVTAGEISGACEHAREIARELKIPLLLIFYDINKFHKGAFEKRSKQIVETGDFFLIFHEGKSKGTLHDLDIVKKSGKEFKYILMENCVKAKNVDLLDVEFKDLDL